MIVTVWVSVASLAIFALAWQELDDTGISPLPTSRDRAFGAP
jgi:hypothetical protein